MDILVSPVILRQDVLLPDISGDVPRHPGASRPHGSAFDNAVLYTVNAIYDELNAVCRQPAIRRREIQVLQYLKVMVKLLRKLSNMGFRRSSSRRGGSLSPATTARDIPVGRDPSAPASSQNRRCGFCGHVVGDSLCSL